MAAIIETLAERVYAHGHAIGLTDAKEIGLPVRAASDDEDDAMWSLLNEYESDLKLLDHIDPAVATANTDVFKEDGTIAVIESTWAALECQGTIEIKAMRQIPQNLNLALNLSLQLPPGIDPSTLPGALQQAMQQAQQQLAQQAHQAVEDAMKKQAPLVGFDAGFRGGKWVKID
jgi:hypothetical protein